MKYNSAEKKRINLSIWMNLIDIGYKKSSTERVVYFISPFFWTFSKKIKLL